MSKASIGIGVIGVLLILASMAGPWWSFSYAVSGFGVTVSGSGDFGLFGVTTRTVSPAGSQVSSETYANASHVGSVFSLGAALSFIGLVLGAGMIIVNAMPLAQPQKGRIGGLLGVFAFLLVLLAAVYVMTSLPTAVNLDAAQAGTTNFTINGFWGSQTTTILGASWTIAWAAAWGWYAVLAAAVTFLAGAVMSFRGMRAPAGVAPGFSPYQQPPMAPPPIQP